MAGPPPGYGAPPPPGYPGYPQATYAGQVRPLLPFFSFWACDPACDPTVLFFFFAWTFDSQPVSCSPLLPIACPCDPPPLQPPPQYGGVVYNQAQVMPAQPQSTVVVIQGQGGGNGYCNTCHNNTNFQMLQEPGPMTFFCCVLWCFIAGP